MSTKAVLEFVDDILKTFPPYRWDEDQEKNYAQVLVRKLGSYPDHIIEKAREDFIAKRTVRQTPVPAEVIEAVVEADRWHRRSQGTLPLSKEEKQAVFSEERERLANDICRGPMGRQAAREGWILPLWNFIIERGRQPEEEHDINACKRTAKAHMDLHEKLLRGEAGGPLNKPLLRFAESFEQRRKQLEKMVLGEEAA